NPHRGMFALSAFGAEPARPFSSALTANPELLLRKKIHEQKIAWVLTNLGTDVGGYVLPPSVTLPDSQLSGNTGIHSQHPTVFCSPCNAIRSAKGHAGGRW